MLNSSKFKICILLRENSENEVNFYKNYFNINSKNVSFIECSKNTNTFKYMFRSRVCVSFYSTTIKELLRLRKKAFFMDFTNSDKFNKKSKSLIIFREQNFNKFNSFFLKILNMNNNMFYKSVFNEIQFYMKDYNFVKPSSIINEEIKKILNNEKKKFPIKLYNKLEDYNFDYSKHITNALTKNNRELSQAAKLIERKIKQNKTIYVCGNGGSSAIANHFVCDYFKGLSTNTNLVPKILSLNAHSELISAISNDLNYDQIFSYQANKLVKKDDLVIIFSSSGKSKNVKKLFQFTKKRRVKTIGFSGFNGGFLKIF